MFIQVRKTMIETKLGNITLYNADCMELLREMPDNAYDLAIVDPPYGLGMRTVEGGGTNAQIRFIDDLKSKQWDNLPPPP